MGKEKEFLGFWMEFVPCYQVSAGTESLGPTFEIFQD